MSDLDDSSYSAALLRAATTAIESGASTLDAICSRCHGASLDVVRKLLDEKDYTLERRQEMADKARQRAALARRRAGKVHSNMPSPDPERAQWWFSLDSIERLCELVFACTAVGGDIGLLGSPSLAAFYATRYEASITLLDADQDVLDAAAIPCPVPQDMRSASGRDGAIRPVRYDVKESPTQMEASFDVLVMDPPWYDMEFRTFASRAARLLKPGAFLISTFPGRLTRSGLADERRTLMREAFCDFTFTTNMPDMMGYSVPRFEKNAHLTVPGYEGQPWRFCDIMIFMRNESMPAQAPAPEWTEPTIETYSKNPRELRLFLAPERVQPHQQELIRDVPAYSETVSRRGDGTSRGIVALWSSTKKGFAIRDAQLARIALGLWRSHPNKHAALEAADSAETKQLVETLYEKLDLPADTRDVRRTGEIQKKQHEDLLSAWATRPRDRIVAEEDDGFRLPHARDRDRIVWSDGLKSLANKTQVFSLDSSDNIRQRLAHSIEVMQLASTISSNFGLDRDLVEAGALAHDIGHTPFGHAGEYALNVTLNAIHAGLGGFNHYEHGVDVVRWLEVPYRSPSAGKTWGLNLTPGVCECIFKHTFCISGHTIGQKELWSRSKYRDEWPQLSGDKPCHIEGQAVRIADKISYLVSDLEDGMRMGVFSLADLKRCALFSHAPLDYKKISDESDLERFIAQRRVLLAFLMEDVIAETARRLSKGDYRRSSDYIVDNSRHIKQEIGEVWTRLQAGVLHRHPSVVSANLQASKMVSSLFVLFALQPSLVDPDFSRSHRNLDGTPYMRWYLRGAKQRRVAEREEHVFLVKDALEQDLRLNSAIGVERRIGNAIKGEQTDGWDVRVQDLVMAKDYVASLTDARARRLYDDLVTGSTRP
ncbi:MAG TPA: dNTP triphosphohydrolase [Kofleriaceae bacterium]|jgi:dGTPase